MTVDEERKISHCVLGSSAGLDTFILEWLHKDQDLDSSSGQKSDSKLEVHEFTAEFSKEKNTEGQELRRLATQQSVLQELAEADDSELEVFTLSEVRLVQHGGEKYTDIDLDLVAWDLDSPEDPRNWRIAKKVFVICSVSLYTFVSPISASITSPASADIAKDLGIDSKTIQALVTSIHLLAWAIGPLFITPLSENDKLGRRRVLNFTCWLTFVFNLSCAFANTPTQILILRFFSGLFSATPLNVSPAVISDMFDAKSRNVSLAGVFLIPFVGAALAPIIGGFVVQAKGWRWVFYVLAIINGLIGIFGTIFYIETYSPTLLRAKAQILRKSTGNDNLHTIYELSGDNEFIPQLRETVTRPIVMLFTNPLVFGLGSFMAVIYGFLYLMIITFPSVFEESYGFSQSEAGLMFLALGIGFVLGVLLWTLALGKVYTYLSEKHGEQKPEFRLPCLFVSAVIMPIGLIWYGWSAQKKAHWVMPCVGSGIFAFGLVCVFQTLQAYLIDVNPVHAASSIAAASIFRFVLGFAFPLFALEMYDKMGYGWGNTFCAILVVLVGFPFPLICYVYGESLRAWINERLKIDAEKRSEARKARLRAKAEKLAMSAATK